MIDIDENRPDPDALLKSIKQNEPQKRGRLKIYFGYAAGVGKTYAMLDDAQEQYKNGVDVIVGYVEPHTRPETMVLLQGLPTLSCKVVKYKNMTINEFDIDAALQRNPELIIVDELAHSNAYGVRNKKRYQDIEELLNAGIDVLTTVNVQHIESLNDVVQNITHIYVQEKIPDYIFDDADKVELIDIEPDELQKRLEQGKIYAAKRASIAMQNFFTKENLRLLREVAMRKAADRISISNYSETIPSEKSANMKFLVCISSSHTSAKCIRWTARTAEALHAPWTAVYFDNSENERITNEQKESLESNAKLAEQLGAEIVMLNGLDATYSIAQYVKLSGITNIVIGRSRNKKSIRSLLRLNFEEKLNTLLSNVEMHIISDSRKSETYEEPKKIQLNNNFIFSWNDTLKTIGILIIASLISELLNIVGVSDVNIVMIYILSVLIVSRATSGYAYGVISSVSSVLTFNFLFTEPYFSFRSVQSGYPLTFLIMLIVALFTSAMTVRVKAQAKIAAKSEQRTEVLYEINKKLLRTRGLQNIVALVNECISEYLERSVIFYTKDSENREPSVLMKFSEDDDATFMLSADERAVAHWVFINHKIAGAGTDTLMGADAFYVPIVSQGRVFGVIGISCKNNNNLNQDNLSFLKRVISLIAMALERQRLSDEQSVILIENEKEKIRGNLLRAISHDLRTPLTGILGASSTILENKDLDKDTQNKLLLDIKEDSQWLIRMVENLLSVTRINEDTTNVTKTPEAVEEIVAEALGRIRNRFKERKINVKVPDELLMVPMDATLIEQVIINLVENSIKHSDSNSVIDLTVKKINDSAVFEVIDNGEGIPEEDLPYLLDGYVNNSKQTSDSFRGMGIGLSICKSIIKAHHGKIYVANRRVGGTIIKFTLPLNEEE